jgi:Holliday junction DNA helicase RuvA
MFEYLRGVYKGAKSGNAVVECGGVGWALAVSSAHIPALEASVGSEVLIYTHHVQREDAQELYGFLTEGERALFRKLMQVSGIGPRQSLRILSGAPPSGIVQALIAEDRTFLSGIPGLGKKTAEKLVFELKGKMDDFLYLLPAAGTSASASSGAHPAGRGEQPAHASANSGDCYAALLALGYSPIEARAALQEALRESGPEEKVEDLVKRALRHVK